MNHEWEDIEPGDSLSGLGRYFCRRCMLLTSVKAEDCEDLSGYEYGRLRGVPRVARLVEAARKIRDEHGCDPDPDLGRGFTKCDECLALDEALKAFDTEGA